MIKGKFTRTEARELGYTIDDHCYPPVAYKGPRFGSGIEWHYTYTELETDLIGALTAIKARIKGEFDNIELMDYGPLSVNLADDCKQLATLALAEAGVKL